MGGLGAYKMSIIKINTGIKGLNYQIEKSFYQCYSGKRVDYHYQVYSCTSSGRQYIRGADNLKSAFKIIDEHKIVAGKNPAAWIK